MTGSGDGQSAAPTKGAAVELPRDRTVYGGLRTSFTRFEPLLEDLSEREFDGFLELQAAGYAGTLFIAAGEVCGGADVLEGGEGSSAAIRRIRQHAEGGGGRIDVYAAPGGLVRLAASTTRKEAVYQGLSTDFVDVDRLMVTLERRRLDGYVQIRLGLGTSTAYVFLTAGEVVDAVLADSAHAGTGISLVPTILEAIQRSGADIDVYRLTGTAIRSTDSEQPVATSVNAGAAALAPAWSAILGAVENVVDGASQPGSFVAALNEVLEERADAMPYLDPAAGDFSYERGEVRFHAPPPADFSRVLGDCLSDAVSRISFRLRKVDLESSIQARLEGVLGEHGAVISRYGIPRTASAFLAA